MNTRREFVVGSAIASLAGATASTRAALADPHVVAQNQAIGSSRPRLAFNRAQYFDVVSRQVKHRHAFGIGRIDGGNGLFEVSNVFAAYTRALNTPLAEVNLASVLYRGVAISIAFNDNLWNEFIIPALPLLDPRIRSDFETVPISAGNPFLNPPSGSNGTDPSIRSLVARGAAFFVCDNFNWEFARMTAIALKLEPQSVYQRFITGLVPGASLVPTGVWAIGALQEAHFSYLQATL